jgi:hypothetical protein
MSNDFDVVTGPPVPPAKIRPAATPAADPGRSREADETASLSKDLPNPIGWPKPGASDL